MTVPEAADHLRRLDEADPFYPPDVPQPPGYERTIRHSVLDFAWEVLAQQQRYAAAARWYAEVFTADPQALADPPYNHRYHAACAAARAGCGQGQDAADLDATSRAGLRRQALDWLRGELGSWCRVLEKEPEKALAVAHGMQDWLGQAYFDGVRGPEALAKLPEAERQAWQRLWTEVEDTLARAEGRIPPPPKAGGKVQLQER
jgi:hypothetical protein